MSQSIVPLPSGYTVPIAPGIPNLAGLATTFLPTPVLAVADSLGLSSLFPPQWGIFSTAGAVLVQTDSVVEMDYVGDSNIPTYPIEQGGFLSYNKVQMPYTATLTMARGSGGIVGDISAFIGSATGRSAFLAQLEALKTGLTLVNVVSPDKVYTSANVTHYEVDRSAETGVSVITARVTIEEVRVTASSATTNTTLPNQFGQTASVNGASSTSTGVVQTVPVTASSSGSLVAANGSGLANALNNPSATSYSDPSTGITYKLGPIQ